MIAHEMIPRVEFASMVLHESLLERRRPLATNL